MEEIASYLHDAAGASIAAQVVERIRSRAELLAETRGELGTGRPELAPAVRSFPVPPFVLFFRYRESDLEIARVLHERRDVGRAFEP